MYNFDICTKVVQRKCIPTTIGTYYTSTTITTTIWDEDCRKLLK